MKACLSEGLSLDALVCQEKTSTLQAARVGQWNDCLHAEYLDLRKAGGRGILRCGMFFK
jgi:hypothetical protein